MYNNFSSKKTKKVISALLASALVVTSAPINADAATSTTKVLGVSKTFTVKKATKVTNLSKAEKKIVKVTVNKKKKTVTVKGLKAGKVTCKIGSKNYTIKVGATKIEKKSFKTSVTAGKSISVSAKATSGKGDKYTWKSSKKSVATVDTKKTGLTNKIKGVVAGTTTITVTSKNTGKKLSVKVTVKAAATETPAVSVTPEVTTTPTATTGAATTAPTATPSVTSGAATTAPGATEAPVVKAEAVKAFWLAEDKVQVDFSVAINEPTVDNFAIEGVTIKSATLTDDQKSVILETSKMTEGSKLAVKTKGIVAKTGETIADAELAYEAKVVNYTASMEFYDKAGNVVTELKSDGQSTAKVVVTLQDENGNVIKDKAEILFQTTAGSFTETKVTIQNGVATNMFTSEASTTKKEAMITATIVSAENPKLLNITTSRKLSLNPNPVTDKETTVGASLTDVVVETCDRVVLYFNKDIKVEDYTVNTKENKYAYNAKKMEIAVYDNCANSDNEGSKTGTKKFVAYLAPVEGNSKAMYAILENGKFLTDNSKVVVSVSDKTGSVATNDTKSTLVSDIRVPSILGVENVGLKGIKVIFSEPIQNTDAATAENAADDVNKWIIDSTELKNDKWGVGTISGASIKAGEFDVKTGEDNRNVVTITLGKDKDGKQIYFKAGKHSVQGNKIGDWANMTDVKNNIINTQTLDFVIEEDDTVPTAKVTVESPEQYLVTFSTNVELVDVQKALTLQKKTDGDWKAFSGNELEITAIDEKNYIVEIKKDWTEIIGTKSSGKNYYNNEYRLHMEKETVVNVLNGKSNAEINMVLDADMMKAPDVDSPQIANVEQDGTEGVIITMNKPVKISEAINSEGLTKAENQASVPMPLVSFISADNTVTIEGDISTAKTKDPHDTSFYVVPQKALTAGKWKVVVRSISDDIGNTSATLVKDDFEVTGEVVAKVSNFEVKWVVAVKNGATNPITGEPNTSGEDLIFVKFNKMFKTYDGAANAGSTTNYLVNGIAVPTTSKIDASLKGYNDKANLKNNYTDLIVLHVGKDKLNNGSNSINISSTIESKANEALTNGGMRILNNTSEGVYTWNYDGYSAKASGDEAITTVSAFKTALAASGYHTFDFSNVASTLTAAETAKLAKDDITIEQGGTYDFSGLSMKSLTIDTVETGTIEITGGTYNTLTVNAPNADVVINGVTITKGSASTDPKLIVSDVLDGTLKMTNVHAETATLEINDNNGGGAVVIDETTFKATTIATTDNISLVVKNSSIGVVELKQAVKLNLDADEVITFKAATTEVEKNVSIKTTDATPEVVVNGADDKPSTIVKPSTGAAIEAGIEGGTDTKAEIISEVKVASSAGVAVTTSVGVKGATSADVTSGSGVTANADKVTLTAETGYKFDKTTKVYYDGEEVAAEDVEVTAKTIVFTVLKKEVVVANAKIADEVEEFEAALMPTKTEETIYGIGSGMKIEVNVELNEEDVLNLTNKDGKITVGTSENDKKVAYIKVDFQDTEELGTKVTKYYSVTGSTTENNFTVEASTEDAVNQALVDKKAADLTVANIGFTGAGASITLSQTAGEGYALTYEVTGDNKENFAIADGALTSNTATETGASLKVTVTYRGKTANKIFTLTSAGDNPINVTIG